MYRQVKGRVDVQRQLLQSLEARPVLQRPHSLVHERRQLLDELENRLGRSVRASNERLTLRLGTIAAALDALSPLKVLARGYSLTTDEAGELITSVNQLQPGSLLQTRLAEGRVVSRIESIGDDD
jgi:exodeoxyribonuclease VII large subunit